MQHSGICVQRMHVCMNATHSGRGAESKWKSGVIKSRKIEKNRVGVGVGSRSRKIPDPGAGV